MNAVFVGEVHGGRPSVDHGRHGRDVNFVAGGFKGAGQLGVGAWNMPSSVDEDEGGLGRGHISGTVLLVAIRERGGICIEGQL